MRKNSTLAKIITEVSGKYGAPMGRNDVDNRPVTIVNGQPFVPVITAHIYDCAVPMCSCCGAYDIGGAYWGSNRMNDIGQLRVQYTKDLSFIRFYRKGKQ